MAIGIISHPDCLLHDMAIHHPEQPARLKAIQDELIRTGLSDILKYYTAPLATQEQLLRVHDEYYVNSVFKASPKKGITPLDSDTWMNPHTLNAALYAAGAGVYAVDLVMSSELSAAFCNIRPPGHHAEKAKAMGFCFFNNVAVAAAHAIEKYDLARVAIIDFDVHHGNGTENIFNHNTKVLYCSSFQSPFYPFSGEHTQSKHIINIPLPAGTTGKIFREKAEQFWFEKLNQFLPEMIFFSAGFDAYIQDPLSDLMLNEQDYAWITENIKKIADNICKGRIVSVLEGGYDLNGLGRCAAAHIKALL